VQHDQVGIGRQTVLGAQLGQRLPDHRRPHERTRRDHLHVHVGQPEFLGGEQAAEVDFLADHHVRAPPAEQVQVERQAPTGPAPHKALAQVAVFSVPVGYQQRLAFRDLTAASLAHRECGEPGRLNCLPPSRTGRERDGVAGCGHGRGERDQRLEMAQPSGEGEQHAHRATVSIRP
jgi:hypothetical protein